MAMNITATQAHAQVDQYRKEDQIRKIYKSIDDKVRVGLTNTKVNLHTLLLEAMIKEIVSTLRSDGYEVELLTEGGLKVSWNLPTGMAAKDARNKTMEQRKIMMDAFITECEDSINGAVENRKTVTRVCIPYDVTPFMDDIVYDIEKNGFETDFSENNGYKYLVIRW